MDNIQIHTQNPTPIKIEVVEGHSVKMIEIAQPTQSITIEKGQGPRGAKGDRGERGPAGAVWAVTQW